MKKPELSAGLVMVKGETAKKNTTSLNFKVDSAFKKRFRQCAAGAELKLNDLLREALDSWERERR